MTKSEVDQAIRTVLASRRTHVEWLSYLERHPEYPTEVCGDIDHQQECIAGYDQVVSVLREAKRLL